MVKGEKSSILYPKNKIKIIPKVPWHYLGILFGKMLKFSRNKIKSQRI
jgi:hypothetical protein